MNTQVPDGYWANARGELIPETKVKPEDKLEDELVRRMAGHARAISEQLTALKALAMSEAQSFKALVAEQYGASRGGKKGNMTLRSFDGTLEMQVAVSEHLTFGPQLAASKELIDDCIIRWSEGSNDNIRALIDQAFQVNKEGRIDTHRVLALRRLDIEDADWKRAMDAISDAVRVSGSKTYVRFYEIDPATERRFAITLDLANA
jgi:ribulose bisphosphate carboxylase small subunit